MKQKLLLGMLIAVAMCFAACGSSSTPATTGGGETGAATVNSLSTIPTVDLSQYDSSASTSANIAVGAHKSFSISKSKFGEDQGQVNGTSRAGCEQNMHKQEVFRMSQMAQLDRCYAEAMETAKLIAAIPTGSYAYYRASPPDMKDEDKTKMCSDIPAERAKERAACEAAGQDKGGKTMLMRLGKFDDGLRIDMCSGDPAVQNNSSTYGASGTVYTALVTRAGNFGGESESSLFNMNVDIGANGKVENGVVTIGDSGYVSASSAMNGRFGSGNISFDRLADNSIKIKGAFSGAFDDPFSGTHSEFTGKTYARAGGSPVTGCAQFSFTGTMPAMRVKDMIPIGISQAALSDFLKVFGGQLGIAITTDNYLDMNLCPNPNFDPKNFNPNIKPMVKLADGATFCDAVTHAGNECFAVTNVSSTSSLGTAEVSQVYKIVAATPSTPYATEVADFVISTLDPSIGEIAFARTWDCTGTFTDIDFTSAAQATVESAMQSCKAIEDKARNNGGMGNEGQCGKGEQQDSVDNLAKDGGGAATFGAFGGEYTKVGDGTCQPLSGLPPKMFANTQDADAGTYCINFDGSCESFTVTNKHAASLNIAFGDVFITDLLYDASPATGVEVTFRRDNNQSCHASYSVQQPSFDKPPEQFGGPGGGTKPGEQGFIPEPCQGLTGSDAGQQCQQICNKPGMQDKCRPPQM